MCRQTLLKRFYHRYGPPPTSHRCSPKCGLKLVPPNTCLRSAQDTQMGPKMVPKGPLRHVPERSNAILKRSHPQT